MRGDSVSFFEDLKAYVDGELSEDRAREVAAALESDPALRAEYEGLRALSSQIQGAVREHPITGLEETLSRMQVRGKRHIPWKALGLSAAAIAVVAIAIPVLRSNFASDTLSEVAMLDSTGATTASAGEESDSFDSEGSFDDGLELTMGGPDASGLSLPDGADKKTEIRESDESDADGVRTESDDAAKALDWAVGKAQAESTDRTVEVATADSGGAEAGVEAAGAARATGVGGLGGAGFANMQLPLRLVLTVSNVEQAATALTKKLSDLKIATVPRTRRFARAAQSERIFRLELSQDALQSLQKELAKIGTVKELSADQTRRAMSLEFKQAEQERSELEERLKDATSDEEKQEIQSQLDRLDEVSSTEQAKPGSITVEIVVRLKGDDGS